MKGLKTAMTLLRFFWVLLGVTLFSQGAALAATSVGVSPTFIVDTRTGMSLAGRVVVAGTGQPLVNATVSIGSVATLTTGSAGIFTYSGVGVTPGTPITISRAGYSAVQRAVAASPVVRSIEFGDIALSQIGTDPQVLSVTPQFDGLFLAGVNISNRFDAEVNWNGRPPGQVEWWIDGTLRTTTTPSGSKAATTFDMGADFQARPGRSNRLEVFAVAADGRRSPSFGRVVSTLPIPSFLQGLTTRLPSSYLENAGVDLVFSFELSLPDDPKKAPDAVWAQLPFLGKFGGDFNFEAGLEYALRTGEWQIHVGTKPLRGWKNRVGVGANASTLSPSWDVGNRSLDIGVSGVVEGVATMENFGFRKLEGLFTLDFKGEVLTLHLLDTVPGTQWVRIVGTALNRFGIAINSIDKVRVYGLMTVNKPFAAITDDVVPALHYLGSDAKFEAGLEAVYAPRFEGVVELTFTLGGKVAADLVWPEGGSLRLNEAEGKIYFSVEAEYAGMRVYKGEFVLLNYKWISSGSPAAPTMMALRNGRMIEMAGEHYFVVPVSESNQPTPVERTNLRSGPEIFMGGRDASQAGSKETLFASAEVFRRMAAGSAPSDTSVWEPGVAMDTEKSGHGLVRTAATQKAEAGSATTAAAPAQADLPLVENIYPRASPAMANRGSELMLLYVRDNGGADLQSTDIAWTRFDGTNWSAPASIAADTRAEFAPQVRYDGNGDAVAVWQRVKDPAFTTVDVAAMAAQMEIVWARWDHGSGQWSVPVALTNNAYLDHHPLLCGPMTNGDVLLVWTANEANRFVGSGAVGAAENSRFMTAGWSATTKTWSTSSVLVNGVVGETSPALDGQGNRAVFVWSSDLDGDVTTPNDSEIYYANWQGGNWGSAVRFTANTTADIGARVAVSSAGNCYLVWRSGADLQWSTNFGVPALARAAADSTGFADYALTLGPGGNVVLLWGERSEAGPDLYYKIYDPASATWGQDDLLTADAPLERSVAPV